MRMCSHARLAPARFGCRRGRFTPNKELARRPAAVQDDVEIRSLHHRFESLKPLLPRVRVPYQYTRRARLDKHLPVGNLRDRPADYTGAGEAWYNRRIQQEAANE